MKKNRKLIIAACTIIVCAGLIYGPLNFGDSENWEMSSVTSMVNTLTYSHNKGQIESISTNQETYLFLIHLNRNQKCKNTSDLQGLSPDNLLLHGTVIKDKLVSVYVRKLKAQSLMDHIFPKFKVIRATVDGQVPNGSR